MPVDAALRRRLLEMAGEDLRVRAELIASGDLFEGYHPKMEAVHSANARALSPALEHGWPGRSRVGEDGAQAAWLIVQHAIGLPDFQRRCLSLLKRAVEEGEGSAAQLAYLTDRIRFFEGRPQVYGTQLDWDASGEMAPHRIEDEAGVDARRAGVGLPPLAQALAQQRSSDGALSKPYAERQAEFEAWARKVGWR